MGQHVRDGRRADLQHDPRGGDVHGRAALPRPPVPGHDVRHARRRDRQPAYNEFIKITVRRERPNGQDNKSFPSGHTSNAFALAAVAQRHYGWKIGVPAYLLAGVMGASRINQDKHWFSDVVGGAALGYIVGRTVVRGNSRPLVPKTGQVRLSVSPILARHARGLQMTAVF